MANDAIESFKPEEFDISDDRFTELYEAEEFLLTVSTKGYGKRTSTYEYRTSGRGGQGVWNMSLTAKNGEVAGTFPVNDDNQIMMVTNDGKLIRMPVENIRFVGRQSQGVILFRVDKGEEIVSIARVFMDEEEEGEDLPMIEGEAETVSQEAASEETSEE